MRRLIAWDCCACARGCTVCVTARVGGCLCLWWACVRVWFTGNQVAIAAAGGIERVLSAMADHAGSAGVQDYGCGALWNLAVNAGTSWRVAVVSCVSRSGCGGAGSAEADHV